jgi:hypothetical protein
MKLAALLSWLATVTVTFPVVAPFGTGTTMLVGLQLLGAAGVPWKLTPLVPCVAPKFVPEIVTGVLTMPDVGLKFAIVGPDGFSLPVPLS